MDLKPTRKPIKRKRDSGDDVKSSITLALSANAPPITPHTSTHTPKLVKVLKPHPKGLGRTPTELTIDADNHSQALSDPTGAKGLSRTPTELTIDANDHPQALSDPTGASVPSSPRAPIVNSRRITRQYALYFGFDDDTHDSKSPEGRQRALKKARVVQDEQGGDRV